MQHRCCATPLMLVQLSTRCNRTSRGNVQFRADRLHNTKRNCTLYAGSQTTVDSRGCSWYLQKACMQMRPVITRTDPTCDLVVSPQCFSLQKNFHWKGCAIEGESAGIRALLEDVGVDVLVFRVGAVRRRSAQPTAVAGFTEVPRHPWRFGLPDSHVIRTAFYVSRPSDMLLICGLCTFSV